MQNKTIPEINIDAIMEKIRREVEQRKTVNNKADSNSVVQRASADSTTDLSAKQTRLWQAMKAIQFRLRRYPFYGAVYRAAVALKRFIPKYRSSITVEDILQYDDAVFIQYAYERILLREADEQGLSFYLSQMKSGRLSKVQVLASMRYSHEGRSKQVPVRGLFVPYIAVRFYKLPLVGYAVRWITAALKLPLIVRNIVAYENYTNLRFSQQQYQMDESLTALHDELSRKADNSAVNRIQDELSTKAAAIEVQNEIQHIAQQNRDQKLNILAQQKNLASLMDRLEQKAVEDRFFREGKGLVQEQSHQFDAFYVSFEDRFRGTQADIKERQRVYLPYVEAALKNTGNASVVDAGCGRGEWLELLKEQGVHARGVDVNRIMVAQSKEHGLDVEEADIVEYLKNQKDDSVSVITGFHIVEHLPFERMVKLLDESFRVLKPKGLVIFETPNPENLLVGAFTFYYDPTHQHPIPPETLKFIAEARGFTSSQIVRLHRRNEAVGHSGDPLHEITERMDMEQDYALIGYK